MKSAERQYSWLNRLQKIGSAGSERVALTLSQMVGAHFEVESTRAKLSTLPEIPLLLQQNTTPDLLVSIHMALSGQIKGRSVLVFPWECAERLDKRLWAQVDNPPSFLSEMSYTAIKELGNVVTSSYLMALEDWIDVSLVPSIPDFSVGLAKTVLDSLIFEYNNKEKFLVCLSNRFVEKELAIKGHMLLFLVSRSVQAILQSLSANDEYAYQHKSEYITLANKPQASLVDQI